MLKKGFKIGKNWKYYSLYIIKIPSVFITRCSSVLKIGFSGTLIRQLLANERMKWTKITLFEEISVAGSWNSFHYCFEIFFANPQLHLVFKVAEKK